MSGTKLALRLSEKQRAWANAFLDAMGEDSLIGQDDLAKPSMFKKGPVEAPLGGVLGELDTPIDERLSQVIESSSDEIGGVGEDISRVGGSKDRGYRKEIAEPVDAMLEQADVLIKQNKLGSEVDKLVVALREQSRRYFANLKGEKDPAKIDQRNRKIDAIDKRISALERLQNEVSGAQTERSFQAQLMDEKDRGKALKENPEIFNAIVAKKPDPENLAGLLTSTDFGNDKEMLPFIEKVIAEHGKDPAYMAKLCGKALRMQGLKEGDSTFFRGTSVANVLANRAVMADPESRESVDGPLRERDKLLSVTTGDAAKDDKRLAAYVTQTVTKITTTALPDTLLAVLMSFAAAGQGRVGVDSVGQIRSQLLLKFICPVLIQAPKKVGKSVVPTSTTEKKAITLVSKALMSIGNGAAPKDPGSYNDYPLLLASIGNSIQAVDDWSQKVWDDNKADYGF